MKTPVLLGALLCASACALAQANTLDLSLVDLSGFSGSGGGAVQLTDATKTAPSGVTYGTVSTYTKNSTTAVRRVLVFSENLEVTGEATTFGLVPAKDGLTLTLNGATIKPATVDGQYIAAAPISDGGYTLTLCLADDSTNEVVGSEGTNGSNFVAYAGVEVKKALTITAGEKGNGILKASGIPSPTLSYYGGAGIGGTSYTFLGTPTSVVIEKGHVIAQGGQYGAGIGSAVFSTSDSLSADMVKGSIEIKGGTVEATGGSCSAAIGAAYYDKAPAVTISGGTVTATGNYGAGIGGAYASTNAPEVTISGGSVTATGGDCSAAIGGGRNSSGGAVSITGGTVNATAGAYAPHAIGDGYDTTAACTLTLTVPESVNTNGGSTPLGGFPKRMLALDTVDTLTTWPSGVSYNAESKTVTVEGTDLSLAISGTNADLTLVVPEGLQVEMLTDSASLKAIQCTGSFTVWGDQTLTVGTLSGNMTLKAAGSGNGMTLTVSEAASTSKVSVVGKNSVTLPAVANLAAFTPLASVTTADGVYPKSYTGTLTSLDLTTLTANTVFPSDSGWAISATQRVATLSVPAGATLTQSEYVTLAPLSVAAAGDLTVDKVALQADGSAPVISMTAGGTLTFTDGCYLFGGAGAAIEAPEGTTLTLAGTGTLRASASSGAAIGGSYGAGCGKVVVAVDPAATLVLQASSGAALGCGEAATSGGEVCVQSGTVVAVGSAGAGIGMGKRASDATITTTVSITGGKVLAYAVRGAAIGGGEAAYASRTDISISGDPIIVANAAIPPAVATVTTKLGVSTDTAVEWIKLMAAAPDAAAGAAIGGGGNGCFGTIAITGGDITAQSTNGAAIGAGFWYAHITDGTDVATRTAEDTISISGANTKVVAYSEKGSAIGGSGKTAFSAAAIGSITIDGEASVLAVTQSEYAAAIGGGFANPADTGANFPVNVTAITIGDPATESTHAKNKVIAASVGKATATGPESFGTIYGDSPSAVAAIGETTYASLGEACLALQSSSAPASNEITLLRDCPIMQGTLSGASLVVPATLNGNGKTLTLAVAPADDTFAQGYLMIGADVTLKNVKVESTLPHPVRISGWSSEADDYAWRVNLEGENVIKGGIGVYSTNEDTVAFIGSGSLTADASDACFAGAAGIGGNGAEDEPCGYIILAGTSNTGTIVAKAGTNAAGIGGGGASTSGAPVAQEGSVEIRSGTIRAYGDGTGAAIGSGTNYNLESITISGGDILAEPKDFTVEEIRYSSNFGGVTGAGIGLYGDRADGSPSVDMPIVISGSDTKVVAKGGFTGCGIGGANGWGVKSIKITDATVTAIGQSSSAAIGSGNWAGGGSGEIVIDGSAKVIAETIGTIVYAGETATGGFWVFADGAGVGGGYANRANVTIGGEAQVLAVNAGGGEDITYPYWDGAYTPVATQRNKQPTGAAIGSGRIPCYPSFKAVPAGTYLDQIVIKDNAKVWAYAGDRGAGIGGGQDSWAEAAFIQAGTPMNFPNISILGNAKVVAVGGRGASAIGGGCDAQNGGKITIESTATVAAQAGEHFVPTSESYVYTAPAAIGTGSYCQTVQYRPSQGNSGATAVPATQPTTTLTVLAGEAEVTTLPIVTQAYGGDYTNLSDSPGLAINLKQGTAVTSVTKTIGSADGNAIVAEAAKTNPVSTDSGTEKHTLDLSETKTLAAAQTEAGSTYLAAANGDVVARLDTTGSGDSAKTTLAVLDPALNLSGTAALITNVGTENPTTVTADVTEKAWLLNAELSFADDASATHDLEYKYNFGISDFTIGTVSASGVKLATLKVGLTEGTTPRTGRVNGVLRVYAGATKIFEAKSPTFTDGAYTFTASDSTPLAPIDSTSRNVLLTVKLEKE